MNISRCIKLLPKLLFKHHTARCFSASVRIKRLNTIYNRDKIEEEETPLTETMRYFLDPAEFYALLNEFGFNFFTGVPDSLLKDFAGYIEDHTPKSSHVIAANEGSAISIAAGYHLGSKKYPVVYLQNSGLGNTVNPILSLADPKVYNIPMLLLVGWRGEPGRRDEPQHMVQGKIMTNILADMRVPFEILPEYAEGAQEALQTCVNYLQHRGGPYAFLVKRQTFSKYELQNKTPTPHNLMREEVLEILVEELGEWDPIVATTGFTSRELYEIRENLGHDHSREFLTVGSMGHASAIAFGIAAAKPSKNVWCIDGDGACLMHMGTIATIGTHQPRNLKHILINNGAHDSVGGQTTNAFQIDFCGIAKAVGYTYIAKAQTPEEIAEAVNIARSSDGPCFVEVLCNIGARKNLGRPKSTPLQNKEMFMDFLES